MKKKLKILLIVSSIILIFLSFSITSNQSHAASGYQGYAVYRDGVVAANIQWHAGLMHQPYSNSVDPVIHAPGSFKNVQKGTWSQFLNGNNFKGLYLPNVSPTSSQRDLIVGKARALVTENISYTYVQPLYYTAATTTGRLSPAEITSMRCDGLVEYVYEFYGFKVYGGSTYWNITTKSVHNREAHAGMTPKSQVNYLKFITSVKPQ